MCLFPESQIAKCSSKQKAVRTALVRTVGIHRGPHSRLREGQGGAWPPPCAALRQLMMMAEPPIELPSHIFITQTLTVMFVLSDAAKINKLISKSYALRFNQSPGP